VNVPSKSTGNKQKKEKLIFFCLEKATDEIFLPVPPLCLSQSIYFFIFFFRNEKENSSDRMSRSILGTCWSSQLVKHKCPFWGVKSLFISHFQDNWCRRQWLPTWIIMARKSLPQYFLVSRKLHFFIKLGKVRYAVFYSEGGEVFFKIKVLFFCHSFLLLCTQKCLMLCL